MRIITKKNVITLSVVSLALFASLEPSFAKEIDYNQVKKDSYKTIAEALYSTKTYYKFRSEVVSILKDLAQENYCPDNLEENGNELLGNLKKMVTLINKEGRVKNYSLIPKKSVSRKIDNIYKHPDIALAEMLIDALASPDYGMQLQAATALASIKAKEAAPLFVELLNSDKELHKLVALRALARIGDPKTAKDIYKVLNNHPQDKKIYPVAVNALMHVDKDLAIKALLPFVNSEIPSIKVDTVAALVALEYPEALEGYISFINDKDLSMLALGELAQIVDFMGDDGFDVLKTVYNIGSEETRIFALGAIKNLETPTLALELLQESAQRESDKEKFVAYLTLAGLDSSNAFEIMDKLTFNVPEFKNKALKLLLKSDKESVLHYLARIMPQLPEEEKFSVAQKLIEYDKYKSIAVETLVGLLESENEFVKHDAALLLLEYGEDQGIELVRNLLEYDNSLYRAKAVVYLASYGDESVIPLLEESLQKNTEPEKSYGAALILYNLGKDVYIDTLIQYLSRQNVTSIDEKHINETLFTELLEHSNPYVRINAFNALISKDKNLSLQPIKDLITDDDPQVRAYALESLSDYGTAQELKAIQQALSDEYVRVRVTAAEAILKIIERAESDGCS